MEKKSIICPQCHNEIMTIKKSYKLLGKNNGISITCEHVESDVLLIGHGNI